MQFAKRIWASRHLRRLTAYIFFRTVPHCRATGMRLNRVGRRSLEAALPYRDDLIGNPWTGALHGGAITTLIDQASGAAASLCTRPASLVATLDLRIDHVRAAQPGRTVYARAECFRITRKIVFVRCVAHDGDADDPVAIGVSSFIRNGPLVRNPLKGLLEALQRV